MTQHELYQWLGIAGFALAGFGLVIVIWALWTMFHHTGDRRKKD